MWLRTAGSSVSVKTDQALVSTNLVFSKFQCKFLQSLHICSKVAGPLWFVLEYGRFFFTNFMVLQNGYPRNTT